MSDSDNSVSNEEAAEAVIWCIENGHVTSINRREVMYLSKAERERLV